MADEPDQRGRGRTNEGITRMKQDEVEPIGLCIVP